MHCPSCRKDSHPTIDLSPEGRAVYVCVLCSTPIQAVHATPQPASPATALGMQSSKVLVPGDVSPSGATPIIDSRAINDAIAQAVAEGAKQGFANETTSPPLSALERTRAELAAKEAELARYASLKLEVLQLRAMVKAAERLERKKKAITIVAGGGGGPAFQPPAGAVAIFVAGGGGAGGSTTAAAE